MVPLGVICPMLFKNSVNHKLPSMPFVMPFGLLLAVGVGNSVIVPVGVIRPILFAVFSVNHRLPSEPDVMAVGLLLAVGIGNSVTLPVGVIRPMLFACCSVNHKLPSEPDVIPHEFVLAVGIGNSVTLPDRSNPSNVVHPFRKPEVTIKGQM